MPRPFGPTRRAGNDLDVRGIESVRANMREARVARANDDGVQGPIFSHLMSTLFSPLRVRAIEFPNRIFVSPMCQYSSDDGMPNDWHFVHLGSRAVGGAGMVCVEASGVTPEGRITPWDAGIWSEAHARAWKPIADFIRAQGSVPESSWPTPAARPRAPNPGKAANRFRRARVRGRRSAPAQSRSATIRPRAR
jgi:hypothetical protein